MSDGVVVCAPDGRVVQCSAEAAALLDTSEDVIADRQLVDVFPLILCPDGRQIPGQSPIWHYAAPDRPFVRGIAQGGGLMQWVRFDRYSIPVSRDQRSNNSPRNVESLNDPESWVQDESQNQSILLVLSATQFPFPMTDTAARPPSVYDEDVGGASAGSPRPSVASLEQRSQGGALGEASPQISSTGRDQDRRGPGRRGLGSRSAGPRIAGIRAPDLPGRGGTSDGLGTSTQVGFFRSTPQHGVIATDEGTEKLFGYAEDELRSIEIGELMYRPEEAEQLMAKRRKEGGLYREHVHCRRRDGSSFWGMLNSTPRKDQSGDVLYYDSVLVDITDQKEAQLALEASEELYRVLAENSVDIITRHALDSTYHYVSPAVESVLGYRPEEIMGRRAINWTHPEDLGIYRQIARALDEDARIKERVRFQHRDGHYVWLEVTGRLIRDPASDRGIEYVASSRDVTAQVKSEAVLRRAAQRLRILSDVSQATLQTTDLETVSQVALDALARAIPQLRSSILAFDVSENEATVLAVHVENGQEEAREEEGQARRQIDSGTGLPLSWLHTFATLRDGKNGRVDDLDAEDRSSPLLQQLYAMGVRSFISVPAIVEGQTIGALNIAHDHPHAFSEEDIGMAREVARLIALAMRQKQVQDDLVEAKETAEEMSRLKSAFLANMSHEIRTPLTAILGFADVLDAEPEAPHDEIARLISRSGQRLMETLDSVLQLSRLESGNLQLSPESADVLSEVRDVVSLMEPRARGEGIELTQELPDGPVEGRYDTMALYRVLSNLVSNAIKFTERGGQVTVRVEALHLDPERPETDPHPATDVLRATGKTREIVKIEVSDTGIGMNPSVIPKLFGAFRQESTGTRRSHEGSGLGLTIVQRLVRLMHGRIDVHSKKGEGSRFTIYLPKDASDPHIDLPPLGREPGE